MDHEVGPHEQVERLAFRAMGTQAELIGVGVDAATLAAGAAEIARLERHWSRFLPDSDLSILNAAGGAPVVLPAVTFDLVALAVEWSRSTAGWFDPTVLPALLAAGYDRSFEQLADGRDGDETTPPDEQREGPRVVGTEAVVIEPRLRSVQLRSGALLDLGGIGKGRAADLVAEQLAAAGHAACVNLGGDLRAVGRGPQGAWSAGVDDPFDRSRTVAVIGIADGAIATSASTRRSWMRGGVRHHHLIDPGTGRPSAHPPASVTVIAPTAVAAEVWAKVALLAGPDEGTELLAQAGLPSLVVDEHGARPANGMDAYLW